MFDLSFEQTMKMSTIKRWGIIDMSRDQSVAEHSYNVAMTCMALCREMDMLDYEERLMLMTWALVHDLPEVMTGDIPTPMKAYLGDQINAMEHELFPKLCNFKGSLSPKLKIIAKIADYVDAIQFAERFCIDDNKFSIVREMRDKMNKEMEEFKARFGIDISATLEKIWQGKIR